MAKPGATLPKRERRRLVKAELLLQLAVKAEQWATTLTEAGTGEGSRRLPAVEEWGPGDPLAALCRTYGLTPRELAQVCSSIGGELEGRALRAGYDEHLDWRSA